eukprot:2614148-Prymnesium_polylepis.1
MMLALGADARPLIDQSGHEHAARAATSSARAGDTCISNAATLLRLSRRFHTTPDPVRAAGRVRAYLKQQSL